MSTPEERAAAREQALLNARNDAALNQSRSSLAAERRRNQVERIGDLGVSLVHSSGVITINGPGEVTVDVPFGSVYTERPAFSTGWELPENHSPVAGSFPTASIGILSWDRVDYGEGRLYFGGALLAIVTSGAITQLSIHWQVYGKAFRNPIGSSAQVN